MKTIFGISGISKTLGMQSAHIFEMCTKKNSERSINGMTDIVIY